MNKFFKCLTNFFSSLAQARAASSLARLGHYDESVKTILK